MGYARWFDLDRFQGRARLHNWICRTTDLPQFTQTHPGSGVPVDLARGDLQWRMAVPDTGILPYDNAYPAVMEWLCATHPAGLLDASGCRLDRLVVSHPDAGALSAEISPLLADTRVVFEAGPQAMRAEFTTPHGPRVLE